MYFGGDPFEHFAHASGRGGRGGGPGRSGRMSGQADTTKLYETLGVRHGTGWGVRTAKLWLF